MERVAPWVKAVNTVLTPAIAGRRKKVDRLLDRAVREAVDRTESTAHGEDAFIEDMRVLLRGYADVEGLTLTGWVGVQQEVTDRLESRLRVRKLHALRPEIADEPISRPIVVIGVPRTGTTMLQRLLAAPEPHRSPLMHELMYPDLEGADHRRRSERVVEGIGKAVPTFRTVYDMAADKPEACVWVLPHGIGHLVRVHPPGYVQWMLERDYTADYRYLKQALQVLQHGRPRRRWILRAPAHLWNLGALVQAFPDAQIVWTHRDPAAALASLCSMNETAMSMNTSEIDLHAIGRTWLGLFATGFDRARTARRRMPAYAVLDVPYRHLTDEARDRMPELFERLGAPWGPTEQRALDASLLDRPTGHRYDLARYGLTEGDVDRALADYKRTFGALL
ncbi:sulfotransferase [Glycomyces sp. TRM65418]|uniref:sulfotransferase family protein n=1 Tax=Glycomyces sp. TRM65418 TaxID=2867006 RepID=UPI001CE53A42|nr:sulfotransferase [Glycomyces sp. TRM65418]MCC3761657.1 sulfotransferase [Glycomyces sp. TRM65418]QZD55751.1 sulfotransferase [Glycomyces sp. TRM65418]